MEKEKTPVAHGKSKYHEKVVLFEIAVVTAFFWPSMLENFTANKKGVTACFFGWFCLRKVKHTRRFHSLVSLLITHIHTKSKYKRVTISLGVCFFSSSFDISNRKRSLWPYRSSVIANYNFIAFQLGTGYSFCLVFRKRIVRTW